MLSSQTTTDNQSLGKDAAQPSIDTAKAIAPRGLAANSAALSTSSEDRYVFKDGTIKFQRDTNSRMLPGVVNVPVGPVCFELRRVVGPLKHPNEGYRVSGLCFPDELLIVVDVNHPASRRLYFTWHELAHAMLSIYNIGEREKLDEESIADALGALMAGITPAKYAEIVAFVTASESEVSA